MSSVEEAVVALARGACVVIPTDTVYGVAAPLTPQGIAALFRVKERPRIKAIPVLGADVASLSRIATFGGAAAALARSFWPGPLTLVVPREPAFDLDLGGADGKTVAVRVPRHATALEIIGRTGPLAVTSANRSGEPPPSTVREARAALSEGVAVYVDAGEAGAEPSTVVSAIGRPAILRQGAIDLPRILAAL